MEWEDLSGWLPRIEEEVARGYASERRKALAAFGSDIDTLREFTLRGGKRLRALLILAGYHLATGRPPTPALPAAAALEHFQSWMLIHDDIIDHSEQRRGGPTVHRSLAVAHRALGLLGSADDYGIGLAITLGDLQEPFTVEALLASPVPPARRLAALSEYVRMTRQTAYGQLLDIRNGMTRVETVTEEDVLLVHKLKSAYYTVAGPLRVGAMLGGARPPLLADLESSGLDLGIAFQLRDDVLGAGLDGEPGEKSANDLTEGKRTLLVVRAWMAGTPDDRRLIEDVLGRADAPAEKIRELQRRLKEGGSLAYSEERIRSLGDRAFRRIEKSRNLRPAGKLLLRQLGEKLLWRQK